MAASRTPNRFSLYDILTRVTPGLILFVPLALYLVAYTNLTIPFGTEYAFLGGILLAFLFGEWADLLRTRRAKAPYSFRNYLYYEEGGLPESRTKYFTPLERKNIRMKERIGSRLPDRIIDLSGDSSQPNTVYSGTSKQLLVMMDYQFDLNIEEQSPYNLYLVLRGYMEPRLSPTGRRYQALYDFSINSFYATLLGISISILISATLSLEAGFFEGIAFGLISILIMSVILLIVTYFSPAEDRFIEALITEYYVDQVQEAEPSIEDMERPLH